eukprot:5161577-Pyramimonas_sp.AAC.1
MRALLLSLGSSANTIICTAPAKRVATKNEKSSNMEVGQYVGWKKNTRIIRSVSYVSCVAYYTTYSEVVSGHEVSSGNFV